MCFIQVAVQMSPQRPPYLKYYYSFSPYHLTLFTCIYLLSSRFLASDMRSVCYHVAIASLSSPKYKLLKSNYLVSPGPRTVCGA